MTSNMGNGSTTTTGYFVEARLTSLEDEPIRVALTTITRKWRRVYFQHVPPVHQLGVQSHLGLLHDDHGLLSYEAAAALMAMTVANRPDNSMFLEFRLRKVKLVTQWEIENLGVSEALNFDKAEQKEVFTKEDTDGE